MPDTVSLVSPWPFVPVASVSSPNDATTLFNLIALTSAASSLISVPLPSANRESIRPMFSMSTSDTLTSFFAPSMSIGLIVTRPVAKPVLAPRPSKPPTIRWTVPTLIL